MGNSPAVRILCVNISEQSVCSILTGHVSGRNNRDETVGIFILEVWLENSLSRLEGRGLRHSTVSPSHTYCWPPLVNAVLHSLFLYSDTPPLSRLAQTIFETTFTCINTPTMSSRLFLLLIPPMKMKQNVPKCQHTKFRHQGITQLCL